MPAPIVVIGDLLEPTRTPHLCNSATAPRSAPILMSRCKPPTNEPSRISSITFLSSVSNCYQISLPTQFWTPFSLLRNALSLLFHTPSLPFLVLPYYHFLGTSYFFQVRFHYRISCRPRITLFSDGAQRFSGKMVYPWRPSTS